MTVCSCTTVMGACYQHSAGVARLPTAQSRLEKDILTMMFLAKCSQLEYTSHLKVV